MSLIYRDNMRLTLLEVTDKCLILVFKSLNLISIYTTYLTKVHVTHRSPHHILQVRGREFY
jgi:hypothetical protein